MLLGAAAEAGLPGACLLGEMPHVFTQFPFPKASLAILEAFSTMTGVELDLTELAEQANVMEEQLGDLFSRVEQRIGEQQDEGEEDEEAVPGGHPRRGAGQRRRPGADRAAVRAGRARTGRRRSS